MNTYTPAPAGMVWAGKGAVTAHAHLYDRAEFDKLPRRGQTDPTGPIARCKHRPVGAIRRSDRRQCAACAAIAKGITDGR